MADFAERERIDLTDVGPEKPLSQGIVDLFDSRGLPIIGPNKRASLLEGSKCDTKVMLRELGIPIPKFENFSDPDKARDYVRGVGYSVVVKADGLAAGKGSLVCETIGDAEDAIYTIMEERIFGNAGDRVDIEERLYGEELSFSFWTDGIHILPMVGARDYKRANDCDEGKNTGGMGSFSPHPLLTPELERKIRKIIAEPLVEGIREKYEITYRGVIYLQLMLVTESNGINPYVLEINIRLGDPETQVILTRLETDLLDISEAILQGRLNQIQPVWDPRYRLCLIATSGPCKGSKGWYKGYPGRYKIGVPITGINQVNRDSLVLHSGTALDGNGQLITTGGRVLCIVTVGNTLRQARLKALEEMFKVEFEGMYFRTDIGLE